MTVKADPREDPIRIAEAVARAAEDLRRRNRLMGWPLVVWRDGRVQWLDAETMQAMQWPEGVREGEPARLPPQS